MVRMLTDAYNIYQNEGFFRIFEYIPIFCYRRLPFLDDLIYLLFKTDIISFDQLTELESVSSITTLDNKPSSTNITPPFEVGRDSSNFRNLPRYRYDTYEYVVISKPVLVSKNHIPVTIEGKLVKDAIEPFPENHYRIKQSLKRFEFTPRDAFYAKTHTNGDVNFDTICSLNTRWNNYYHWMVEQVPKIRAVNHYKEEKGKDVQLIIPQNPTSFMLQSLSNLGYNSDCLIKSDCGPLKANEVIQPKFVEPTLGNLIWLRENMAGPLNKPNNAKRLFISRQDADKRHIKNNQDIFDVLNEFGIDVVVPGEMTLNEQISIFSKAELIIGLHGAGLTNIIWPDETTVVEIFGNVIKPPYFEIANTLGHQYVPFKSDTYHHDTDINNNVYIDPSDLSTLLNELVVQ